MSVRDVIQAAAGSATGDSKTYIEDVFSTYLYTGNGSTQTINNGIDLAGKGGMVWIKDRLSTTGNPYHTLFDTSRGTGKALFTNLTSATDTKADTLTAFNSNGFSLGADASYTAVNYSGLSFASWTFRKAPKFFDVVTYTGDGVNGRTISHSLGTAPGMIIIKCTSNANQWVVYHRSGPINLFLNNTNASEPAYWITGADASTFTIVATIQDFRINTSGATYVAYLFAHDTTTDGLIQCGSYTSDASGLANITLGWEPQYILVKRSNDTGGWYIFDTMRGFAQTQNNYLAAEISGAEGSLGNGYIVPTATGFNQVLNMFGANKTMIYMAIRRGPMKTPTDGTKVFTPSVYAGSSSPTGTVISSGFPVDLYINKLKSWDQRTCWVDRLRGDDPALFSQLTQAEESYTYIWPYLDEQLGIRLAAGAHDAGQTYSNLSFRRAPGFFDVVCYTGTGSASESIKHNLGVAPNLIFIKMRNATESYDWVVYNSSLGSSKKLYLNTTNAELPDFGTFGGLTPTATTFGVGNNATNASARTFVAYLFASCPGVSKVGSYTGNGSSQTINCGFTNGARFVLIKRTDSTGDWYVWDTARGIVAGTDPHLSLNTTAAEVTTDDTIDPNSTGFIVNQVTATNVNVNAATYIYLAIA